MAFSFITAAATGTFQTLSNRLIEDPASIDLTDTPGPKSIRSIPFDGIDDSLTMPNPMLLADIGNGGTGGLSASNLAFDCWLKLNATANSRNTFFDASILRSACATSSGFDGIYNMHIITTGGGRHVDFRIDHNITYTLTSMTSIATGTWTHVMCVYNSGDKRMQIWINGLIDRQGDFGSASVVTGAAIGSSTIRFNGKLDEMRMWIMSGAASSISRLASITSIGVVPEDSTMALNEFSPSSDTMAAWWRLDSTSAFQLFSSISSSIVDYTSNAFHATPSGFQGADNISVEATIVQGLSASGDLKYIGGGDTDHGGLLCLDPNDGTIVLESGAQNLIKEGYTTWTASGGGSIITLDNNNIFYGASAVKVKTTAQDTGAYIDISNSALLFSNNIYTCGFRYRSVSGSTSARVVFSLGTSATTITANTTTTDWKPIYIRNTLLGTSLTGRVIITQLNVGTDNGSLFQIDGFNIIEGDYPASFIGEGRIRKSGQSVWEVLK